MGFAFPFPFGFFSSTKAEDGDPMDVLLLTDTDLPMGSLVRCRILGGIAMEESSEGKTYRNDRLMAVPLLLHQDRPPYELSDMPQPELKDIEDFLVAYLGIAVGPLDGADVETLLRIQTWRSIGQNMEGRAHFTSIKTDWTLHWRVGALWKQRYVPRFLAMSFVFCSNLF